MIKQLIDEIRSISRMSDYQIANAVGCTQSYICMLRNGSRKKVSLDIGQNLIKLRDSLPNTGTTLSRRSKKGKKFN